MFQGMAYIREVNSDGALLVCYWKPHEKEKRQSVIYEVNISPELSSKMPIDDNDYKIAREGNS